MPSCSSSRPRDIAEPRLSSPPVRPITLPERKRGLGVRPVLAALALGLALGATPSIAANVSGLYAGIYAGGTVRNASDFDFDIITMFLSTTGTIETPASIVNGGIDPLLFDYLNEGLAGYPFADLASGGGNLTQGSLAFDPGLIGGIVVGYGFGNGFRIEGDFSATSSTAGLYTPQTGTSSGAFGSIDGSGVWTWVSTGSFPLPQPPPPPTPLEDFGLELKTDVQFLLVNGLYDFDTGTSFTPYFGAGLGLALVSSTLTDLCGCGAFSNSAIVPAGQLGGGVRISVSDPITLDIGYRYKLAASPDLVVNEIFDMGSPAFPAFGGFATRQSGLIGIHALQAGLTFALN